VSGKRRVTRFGGEKKLGECEGELQLDEVVENHA
jgi:hypothetical protein